jgi:hypothetical protein
MLQAALYAAVSSDKPLKKTRQQLHLSDSNQQLQ